MDSIRERFITPSLNTLFANSRITKRALIVVEGKDDIQFYSRVGDSIGKSFKIQAVENIDGYTEGCEQIVKLVEDFQEKISEEAINKKYFLAIIDNDVRRFRGDEVNFQGLFTLKHYSFESHYFTSINLKKLILDLTQVDHDLLLDTEIESLRNDISEEIVESLYLPSLEALKNALETDYDNLVGYKTAPGSFLNNQNLINQLKEKESNLNTLASSLGLQKNYETIRNIAKGKWVLASYSKSANSKIKNLVEKCKEGHIKQCQYCSSGNSDKCMYKMQLKPQEGPLIEMIKNILDRNEIAYIFDRLSELN